VDDFLSIENLREAWERVADNRGAPGLDRVSIQRFGRNWEENLRRLRDLVYAGHYKPARLRRIAVPKRSGGQRLLTIPTVADRVLQRAVLNVLDDVYERVFLSCSYGYRMGRSIRSALQAMLDYRDRGLTWVLDADIDECFDSLDHAMLLGFLAEHVRNEKVLSLIRVWLEQGRRCRDPDRGIPLGMPISPLLCNVYLHRMDHALRRARWALVRYADDFAICCSSEEQAWRAAQVTAKTLADLRLRLEPHKTRVTSFEQGFEFLGIRFERDHYSFTWEEKTVEVHGPVPEWLWGYVPGYED
jgi:group II intron reverse transcriptase/maturase